MVKRLKTNLEKAGKVRGNEGQHEEPLGKMLGRKGQEGRGLAVEARENER